MRGEGKGGELGEGRGKGKREPGNDVGQSLSSTSLKVETIYGS